MAREIKPSDWLPIILIVALVWLALRGGVTPGPSPTTKATAAVFVYEKDSHAIPSGVLSGINKLNRETGIIATTFDEDTLDGTKQTPAQYVVPLAAAREAGLPSLVVMSGAKVLRVVKNPTTESAVLEAVR